MEEMEEIYAKGEREIFPSNSPQEDYPPPITPYNQAHSYKNNLNSIPHKGIFQPDPNTLICKSHCCCKFIGLYVILYGSFFGIVFTLAGLTKHFIVFTIIGLSFFTACLIVGIYLFYSITTEVKFIFSDPMLEINVSSVLRKKKRIVNKNEIANIIFEYSTKKKGAYHSLHIMFNNGIQENYFSCSCNPPCFTKDEIDYFNNEMKNHLEVS